MESSVLSASAGTRAKTTAATTSVPWHLGAVVFAATCVIVGLIWDISWHMSIGRDTFWTPAHMVIYTGGIVAGVASGFEVLRRSFFADVRERERNALESVRVWRIFYGPLGGWLCIWGAVAMLTSAPFDDWWHNAYGLDVKILSPPHTILALGFLAILFGATMLSAARQTRENSVSSAWTVAYTSGLVLTIASIMFYEFQERLLMHAGIFYMVMAAFIPFFLVSAGVSVRMKWPATIVASLYTIIMLAQLLILPLFAATPLLGPIQRPITHMVPLNFPLLIIPAALLLDVVLRKTEETNALLRAVLLGLTFVVGFTLVQWPFAIFLMDSSSHNWFFQTDKLPYFIAPGPVQGHRDFIAQPTAVLIRGLLASVVIAMVSSRAGIAWGRWLRSVQR